MAELEEELIGEDLDYEYDLDEEEEEALLAGEDTPHEGALDDIIELRVEEEFDEDDGGGQLGHAKSVHSRLQPSDSVFEEDLDHQYEQETPISNVQVESQNIVEEEEEEEEEEEDDEEGRSRDRFKSERSKISLTGTTVERIIPESLDEVRVKKQDLIDNRRGHGRGGYGRDRGRGWNSGGGIGGGNWGRGMHRGCNGPPPRHGGMLHQPPHPRFQPPRPMQLPAWEPLMYAAHMQMSKPGLHMNRNGPPGMGRPPPLPMVSLANSLIQRPPPLMTHNPGFPRLALRNNNQWSTGVLPLGAGAILNQFVQQSQQMPREDLRSSLKRRSDPPNITPPKQLRVGQPPPPMNNQQAAPRKKLNNAMNRQRGGPAKKGPILSRLSMPPANPNPNLTTIKTVDIGHMTKQKPDNRPHQNNPSQNEDNQSDKGNHQQQQQRHYQQEKLQQNQQHKEQEQREQDSKQQGMSAKDAPMSADKNSSDPMIVDPEYQEKLLRQKQLRQQILAKKEARRKAAAVIKASEIASRKAKQEMDSNKKSEVSKPGDQQTPSAPHHHHHHHNQQQQQLKQQQQPPPPSAARGPKGGPGMDLPHQPASHPDLPQSPMRQPFNRQRGGANSNRGRGNHHHNQNQQRFNRDSGPPDLPPDRHDHRRPPQSHKEAGLPLRLPASMFTEPPPPRGRDPGFVQDGSRQLFSLQHQPAGRQTHHGPPQDEASHQQRPPPRLLPPTHHPPPPLPHPNHPPPHTQHPPPHHPQQSPSSHHPHNQPPPHHHHIETVHHQPPPIPPPHHHLTQPPSIPPMPHHGPPPNTSRPPQVPHSSPPPDYPPHRDSHSHHHPDHYPPQPETFPPRVPPPNVHHNKESRHQDYGSEGRYGEPPSWEGRHHNYREYEDNYREPYDDGYYQKDHHYDSQGYQDQYRHSDNTYTDPDQSYRDDYQKHRHQHQHQQQQQQQQQQPQQQQPQQEHYPQDHYPQEEYSDNNYREEKYQENLGYEQPKRVRDIKSRLGGRMEGSQNPHHLQVKVVQSLGQDQEATPPQQEGQKIQTVHRQKTAVSRKFRRITRRSPHGEIVSITRIPVDEDGNQIGPQITEYEANQSSVDKPDTTASAPPQFQQSRVSVVKNLRQIVRKVPVSQQQQQQQQHQHQHQHQQHQQQQQVKLREMSQMDPSGSQQQPLQQFKVLRTVVSSEDTPAQLSSTGRRIVTTTNTQAGGRGSNMRVGTGIRRVVTTASTNQDMPTVQLCDLPSNLTLADINQMVADAGVGQPMSVDYIPGSRECMLRFQVAEVAAKFSQKINHRMVNMSFIRANAIL